MENILERLSSQLPVREPNRIVGWGGSPRIFHCLKALAMAAWRGQTDSLPCPWVFYPSRKKRKRRRGRRGKGEGMPNNSDSG